MKKIDEAELLAVIEKIIIANPKQAAVYKNGKTGIIMFFVGLVMRELKGKGDAQNIRKLLENRLE